MLQELFSLSGQVALVTGASRGFGLEIAKLFSEAGATVILNGRYRDTLEEAAKASGGKADIAAFDVADTDASTAAVAEIEKKYGKLDILVNNAGTNIRKPLAEVTLQDWRTVIDTNLTGAFALARAAGLGMARRGHGRIINVGSVLSILGRANIAAYTASKHGIAGFTKSFAAELGASGVTCNAIAPGYFETELNRPLMDDAAFFAFVNQRTPLRRWGQPRELAGAALFLASPAGSYVNGHVLAVDGGMTTTI